MKRHTDTLFELVNALYGGGKPPLIPKLRAIPRGPGDWHVVPIIGPQLPCLPKKYTLI